MGSRVQIFKTGSILIKENDSTRKMFIIKSGTVRVYKTYFNNKVTLATLGPGEVFGELSFFDSEPRSASVDALSEVEVIVIDGEKDLQAIKNLPPWVISIFKNVFHRLRETDHKLMVLQNVSEFQKKTSSKDLLSEMIYSEMLRFNKTLEIIYEKNSPSGSAHLKKLEQEMDDVLGKKEIPLKLYLKLLQDNHIINAKTEGDSIEINVQEIKNMNKYINKEQESGRFLILDHPCLSFLRSLVSTTSSGENAIGGKIHLNDIDLTKMPFSDEAVPKLTAQKVFTAPTEGAILDAIELREHFVYQTILISFDRSTI